VDRSRFRSFPARALLCPCDRNPDSALGDLPVGEDRHSAQGRYTRLAAGTRLDFAGVVQAMTMKPALFALLAAAVLSACSETASAPYRADANPELANAQPRSEEHTSELQSRENLVCR